MRQKYSHTADPIWAKGYKNKLICSKCGVLVIGDGTVNNPWRHNGEKIQERP